MKKTGSLFLALMLLCGCSFSPNDNIIKVPTTSYTTTSIANEAVSFIAVGDNLIHSPLYHYADKQSGTTGDGKYDFSSFYTNVAQDLSGADLSFVNQETILGGGTPSNYPCFNTPDSMALTLNNLGVDIVNGSTNHALDRGNSGIAHAIATFKQYQQITYIGLYASRQDAATIKTVTKNGITFALLAYTYGTNGFSGNGYNITYFSPRRVKSDVAKARKLAEFVIVSAHWGTEYSHVPNSYQKKYAKILNEAGADLVIGTHPHVIQPMQWLTSSSGHKTLVAYSLGNFLSTQNREDALLEGMLSCTFRKIRHQTFIEDVVWTPLVNHNESGNGKPFSALTNMKIYKLKDYSEALASRHSLNGYRGITISKSRFLSKTLKIIGDDFKIDD